jgi:hypothetical protein
VLGEGIWSKPPGKKKVWLKTAVSRWVFRRRMEV